MLELAYLQDYHQKWKEAGALRAGIARQDVVEGLTGGGVTTAGVHALAEFLAGCYGIEQGTGTQPAYRGGWQNEIVDWIGAHTYNTVQVWRRAGKSYAVGLWATAYMAAGYRVIMAMPTMQQGSRLIFRQVSRNMHRLAVVFPALRNRLIDNATNILLENAGELTILSADKGAEKEGYGCEYLIVDEAHKCDISTLAVFQPFTDDAVEQGVGRVSLIGIGGPEESAIEAMQQEPSDTAELDLIQEGGADRPTTRYDGLRMDSDEYVKIYPQLAARFERARRLLLPMEYDQHYRCKTVPIGTRMIYPGLRRKGENIIDTDSPRYVFGIDVGKKKDATVVAALMIKDSKGLNVKSMELVHYHEIRGSRYPEQAPQIMEYIAGFYKQLSLRPIGNIAIETNGPGEALADILEDYGIVDIQRSWTDDKWKRYIIRDLQRGARDGSFSVPDSQAYRQLAALSFEIDGFGKEKWEHNDLHSALLVAAEIA